MFSTMSWTMSRPVTRSLMALTLRTPLEQHAHADLGLSRIAEAALDRPVEIEHEVRHLGPFDVAVVGQVEHLEDRLNDGAAGLEVPRDAQIPTEELVVLAQRVPLDDRAICLNAILRRVANRLGLRRSSRHAVVELESLAGGQQPRIGAVPLVAMRAVLLWRGRLVA